MIRGPLNRYQKHACKTYGRFSHGDFAHIADITDPVEAWREIEAVGDTIFRGVMLELDDGEGCESADEAENRIQGAIHDLEAILAGKAFGVDEEAA